MLINVYFRVLREAEKDTKNRVWKREKSQTKPFLEQEKGQKKPKTEAGGEIKEITRWRWIGNRQTFMSPSVVQNTNEKTTVG